MNEARAAMVKKWCKENPAPVQELCPEINQYFRTSKGYYIWNSRDAYRTAISWDPTFWTSKRNYNVKNLVPVRDNYEGIYIRYISEWDALEIARVWMAGGRGKDDEYKEWTYTPTYRCYYSTYPERFILFRNDSDAYLYNGDISLGNGYYAKETINMMKNWTRHALPSDEAQEEFEKFTDDKFDNMYNNTVYMWQYIRWYRMNFIKRDKSKTYKNLADYEFDDIEFNRLGNAINAIYFQQLDDKYAVLRVFKFPSGWEKNNMNYNHCNEVARLFVSNKGKPTLMVEECGVWKIKSSTPWRATCETKIVNREEMETWKPLKYILPCLGSEPTIQAFINYLRHPVVEQLYKAGYHHIAKGLCRENQIVQNMKYYFGIERERKQPIFKLLGVNKFVLNAAEEQDNLQVVKEIKYYCGGFDATAVPEDICKYIGRLINTSNYTSITELVPNNENVQYFRYRRNRYNTPLTDEQRKWLLRLFKMEDKREGSIQCFRDVISTYNRLINKPDIDLFNVHNYDEIQRMHDALVNLQIEEERNRRAAYDRAEKEKQERAKKSFEKLQDERIKKYEYENDEFAIRVPHELNEITREGIVLNHCVGGYLDRHANGYTNIIFIRRKADVNVPWYTMEINNDNRVVQIHGSHNRWLGNNPEVVPFVYTYLTKIGAKFDKSMLLNKGAGYSAGNESLDESYLKEVA